MSKKTPLIISALAIIALVFISIKNKAKKFLGYLTYEIASFKVQSITLSSVKCKIGVSVNNPSETSVTVKDYKVEVYLLDKDNKRSLLAVSPVNQLSIPAKQKITLTSDVTISISQAAKLIGNLTKLIMSGQLSDLSQKLLNEIKAKTVVVIKATVMDQFIEKELKW